MRVRFPSLWIGRRAGQIPPTSDATGSALFGPREKLAIFKNLTAHNATKTLIARNWPLMHHGDEMDRWQTADGAARRVAAPSAEDRCRPDQNRYVKFPFTAWSCALEPVWPV